MDRRTEDRRKMVSEHKVPLVSYQEESSRAELQEQMASYEAVL